MLVKDKINKNFCIATIILKKNQKARHIFTVGRLGERLGSCTEIALSGIDEPKTITAKRI